MSDDPRFERSAREWLEAGPDRAPDRAVQAAFHEIDVTPQERDLRVLRRFNTMPMLARVAVAAIVGVLFVGAAFAVFSRSNDIVGDPGPTASAAPSATATGQSFDYTTLPGWIVFEHFGQAPDGSTTEFDLDRRQIWLVHADGTGLHELTPGQPVDGKYAPDISPDGRNVVFSTWDRHVQVWEAGIDGGAPRLLTTDCSGVPDVCREEEPAYSPDGTRVVLVRADPQSTVLGIRDLTTGTLSELEPTRTAAADGRLSQPSWSPDGRQIVFSNIEDDPSSGDPVNSRIFTVDADGTGLHQLPLDEAVPWGDPDWSPDGSRIVFSSWPIHDFNSEEAQVYSARPDGSDLQMLTTKAIGGEGAASWTPDGAHILLWGPTTFWMMDPDGRNHRPINAMKLTYFGDIFGYGYYGYLQPTP